MTIDDRETAVLKFKSEFLGLLRRWLEESDLSDMELVEACVQLMNEYCQRGAIEFDPGTDFSDPEWGV